MLTKAFVFGVLLAVSSSVGQAQNFNEFQPFAWNWHSRHHLFDDAAAAESAPEREELSPTYQDPARSEIEKPVLQPGTKPSFNAAVLPGGVIDVDAGSFLEAAPESDGFGAFGHSGHFPGGGLFNLGGFFGTSNGLKPWWKGEHVCIEREESTDDDNDDEDTSNKEQIKNTTESSIPNFFSTAISLSNCQQSPNKYECITKINNHGVFKTFIVRYKCCYGFTRSSERSQGCDEQLNLKPLFETVAELGANEYKTLITNLDDKEKLSSGNWTIFAPADAALNEYNERMSESNDLDRGDVKNPLSNDALFNSYLIDGFVNLNDYSNDDLLQSAKNTTLRVNFYPTQNGDKLQTINCARVTKPNQLATNGVVHLIDRITLPATQTLEEIINHHPKLTNLAQVFRNTDSFKNLRSTGHYTIFAPTDEAFNKLDANMRQKLVKGADSCGVAILKHHITSHTVCTAAILGNATTHNIEGEVLNLERTADDQLVVEDSAKVIEGDVIGTNGVLHLIDEILVPDSALHINDALKAENLTKFEELISRAGLEDEVEQLVNSTVFAPSNEAFNEPKVVKFLEEIGDDKEQLRNLVRYHTLNGQLPSCEMQNNVMLKTNDGNEIRLNLYSTLPLFTNVINRATVNCARLVGFDQKSCGSMIHQVSKVLLPPKSTILDLIRADSKYTTLNEILAGTEVEQLLEMSNQSITFLAPTDETFAAIDEADLRTLKSNKKKAEQVLKNHILEEVLCCSGVGPQTFGFNTVVPTLSHQHLQIGRTGSHQIRIGRAVVTSCDNLATNGVVHTVNKVLFPQRQQGHNFGGFFLFDL